MAPVFQGLAVVAVVCAAIAGVLQWGVFVRVLALLSLGGAIFTGAAFLLEERARRTFSKRDLAYMIVLAPLEFLFYRPVIMFAQLKGTIDFLLGDRRWNKFDRNNRDSSSRAVEPPDRKAA